jgi:hypothetical protein
MSDLEALQRRYLRAIDEIEQYPETVAPYLRHVKAYVEALENEVVKQSDEINRLSNQETYREMRDLGDQFIEIMQLRAYQAEIETYESL